MLNSIYLYLIQSFILWVATNTNVHVHVHGGRVSWFCWLRITAPHQPLQLTFVYVHPFINIEMNRRVDRTKTDS